MLYQAKQWRGRKRVPDPQVPVFIVDDDMSYLYSLGFYLKKDSRCKIYCYSSGEDCIRNLYLNPRVIILDYYLSTDKPGAMDGLDVLKKVKLMKPETKVIMLSGQETLQVATTTLQSGAFTYVIKDVHAPFSIRNIIDILCGGNNWDPDAQGRAI